MHFVRCKIKNISLNSSLRFLFLGLAKNLFKRQPGSLLPVLQMKNIFSSSNFSSITATALEKSPYSSLIFLSFLHYFQTEYWGKERYLVIFLSSRVRHSLEKILIFAIWRGHRLSGHMERLCVKKWTNLLNCISWSC